MQLRYAFSQIPKNMHLIVEIHVTLVCIDVYVFSKRNPLLVTETELPRCHRPGLGSMYKCTDYGRNT